MKHLRLLMATFAVFLGLSGLVPAVAMADTAKQTVCQTIGGGADCSKTPKDSVKVNSLIATVVNVLSFVITVASVIMIMIGAFRYVTSGGGSNSTNSAKNTILYAVIGLAIAAAARAIVYFVLEKVQG